MTSSKFFDYEPNSAPYNIRCYNDYVKEILWCTRSRIAACHYQDINLALPLK